MPWEVLIPRDRVNRLVQTWVLDDAPSFEVGGFVVGDDAREARLLAKSPGVFAGRVFAQAVFEHVGNGKLDVEWRIKDGDDISPADAKAKRVVAVVRGPARAILLAERTALNILARASGVATSARKYVTIAQEAGWSGHIAATRKTTPGFGIVEKYAVLVGGASTHRMDLSQMTMLKDNHVWSVGSIRSAVDKARVAGGFSQKIEVEARTLEEAIEAAEAGAEVVMLDNMPAAMLRAESAKLKARFPSIIVEASGGITDATLKDFLCPTVDVVSIGKLTQGYSCLDFSLKVTRPGEAKL